MVNNRVAPGDKSCGDSGVDDELGGTRGSEHSAGRDIGRVAGVCWEHDRGCGGQGEESDSGRKSSEPATSKAIMIANSPAALPFQNC